MIEIKKAVKNYPMGVKAIDNINLLIQEGEFVCIVGDSGSGKTTLLNVIGGMDILNEGEIIYKGQNIALLPKKKLEKYRREAIGFVFQNYNLIPNLTAYENVNLINDIKKNNQDALEMLEMVGLSDKAYKFPNELSGGEAQRVAIARAIMKKPAMLLCDEPTGALDYENGKNVLKIIKKLNDLGMTIIMVTHNLAITPLANHLIRLRNGKIVEEKYMRAVSIEDLNW